MKTIGNIIWLLFGGLLMALEYFVASVLMCLTIVGIPFGLQTIKLAALALWPFNKEVVYSRPNVGCFSTFMNLLWLIFGGICICLSHLIWGIFFTITIIGIPFARQHFKLAGLALTPFGREIRGVN